MPDTTEAWCVARFCFPFLRATIGWRGSACDKRGLPWRDLEPTLGAEEAAKLRKAIEDEVLSPGFLLRAERLMLRGQAAKCMGRCLLVLGPSAAGKSHAIDRCGVEMPPGAFVVDGSILREASLTWSRALRLATANGLGGFSDCFERYFKAPMDEVKHNLVDEAIARRANLVVPETASHMQDTLSFVDRLAAAGYTLSFAAIYADADVCAARGASRQCEEGKRYSGKNWEASIAAIVEVQKHLKASSAFSSAADVQVFSNMGVIYSMTIAQLELSLQRHHLTNRSPSLGCRWCETRLLAGVYRDASATDERRCFEVLPCGHRDEQEDVTVAVIVIVDEAAVESLELSFNVASCCLRASAGCWKLCLDADGSACLKGEACENGPLPASLVQFATIPGKSLSFPVSQDQSLRAALSGLDFCQEDLRAFTKKELDLAFASVHLLRQRGAPTRVRPRAVFFVAPSGGGKTSLMSIYVERFDLKLSESVLVDGTTIREAHGQSSAIVANGQANQGIWYRAWPAVKKNVSRTKKQIFDAAMERRKDMLISDTGAETAKLVEDIEKLKSNGYTVSVCCIFAKPEEIIARGVAREIEDGKRYNQDVNKLGKSFESFAPAIRAANGTYCLVRNSSGKAPELHREGHGGDEIDFSLEASL